MKHIYLNLKRFDIPPEFGGVNRLASIQHWGETVVASIQDGLFPYKGHEVDFTAYLPEAHLLSAASARKEGSPLLLGAEGVSRLDTAVGGNFGALTSLRPAAAVQAMGLESVLIGHCEERRELLSILSEGGSTDSTAVNRLLNREILAATARGLKVLYCIGETEQEQPRWQEVLRAQLEVGLKNVSRENIVIAYEPVWSIGPGKIPADREYIQKIAQFVKEVTNGLDVVYGGGLKEENAEMLASIPEIDGGLIALTRFSGEIGFYPEEFLSIVRLYLGY